MTNHSARVFVVAWLALAGIVFGTDAHAASAADSVAVADAMRSDMAENPLRPANTSSPRATLRSFIYNMNRSYRVLMAAHWRNTEASGVFTSGPAKQMAKNAEVLLQRAVSCLDLSEVPSSLKKDVAYELALQLKEILDRIEFPPDSLIPGSGTLEREWTEKNLSASPRWRVPNTDVVIGRVEDGPREGEYLFTPRTVARLGDFYDQAKDLPYKSSVFVTQGFLEFYVTTPGGLLPPKWNEWLPAWSKRVYLSHTVWQWCALVVLLVLWFLVVVSAFRTFVWGETAASRAARSWSRALFCLISLLALLVVHVILRDHVNMTGSVLVYLRVTLLPVWWFLLGAMTFFVATGLAEMIIASPRIDPEGIQASYFRALFFVLGFVGGAAVFSVGLSRIGVSLIPLLTGLGLGGLAVALAARPTIENVISSFTIFADNPYRVGERVNVLGHIGTVESIGLRSTRIRLLNEHVTAIPNEKMAAAEVENIGRRTCIRRSFNITITYDTPPEKISRAVDILREILAVPEAPPLEDKDAAASLHGPAAGTEAPPEPHPNLAINRALFPPRVYFNEFNADSLNLYVSYWFHPPDFWEYMEHAHRVNMQIKERFNAEGISFAFPTQTLHLAGDENHPLNISRPISDEKTS